MRGREALIGGDEGESGCRGQESEWSGIRRELSVYRDIMTAGTLQRRCIVCRGGVGGGLEWADPLAVPGGRAGVGRRREEGRERAEAEAELRAAGDEPEQNRLAAPHISFLSSHYVSPPCTRRLSGESGVRPSSPPHARLASGVVRVPCPPSPSVIPAHAASCQCRRARSQSLPPATSRPPLTTALPTPTPSPCPSATPVFAAHTR